MIKPVRTLGDEAMTLALYLLKGAALVALTTAVYRDGEYRVVVGFAVFLFVGGFVHDYLSRRDI